MVVVVVAVVVVVMAVRLKRSPSQLLMPLVFSAHAGSILALTGSPVNVLVSEAAKGAGTSYFGFFEFSIVGVPLLIGTISDELKSTYGADSLRIAALVVLVFYLIASLLLFLASRTIERDWIEETPA